MNIVDMGKSIAVLGFAFAMATSGALAEAMPSSPAAQMRELRRRESVIELKAQGCYSLADTPGELSVKAWSPAGRDISKLSYCICDESGKEVCRYRDKVSGRQAKLAVKPPARPASSFAKGS